MATFDKLPFDFDRHRISKYKIADANQPAPADQKKLTALVTLAVETILDQNPLRPREVEGKSEFEIKHDRDLVNIKWFLHHISIDMLGSYAQDMPEKLHYSGIMMSDGLNGVVNSLSFQLYDKVLENLLRSLYNDLKVSLSFPDFYRDTSSTWVHAFGVPGPGRDHNREEEVADKIEKIVASLVTTLSQVVSKIRTDYLEIDLDETSRKFVLAYRKMVQDIEAESD